MGHKCYDLSDYNKTHQSGFLQFKRKPVQKYVKKFNPKNGLKKQSVIPTYQMEESSDVTSGWAGWALTHPKFGSSVNPIPTGGTDHVHQITACSPGFENLTASLESKELPFSDMLDQAFMLRRKQGTSSRLNEIKEKSKDIQEENVEMGISCSTTIDCEQDMIPTYQMEESNELSFSDMLDQAFMLRSTSTRLDEIKEKSRDIQEENVEMGIFCSTNIDFEQDNKNDEEDQVQIPVIVEYCMDPLGRAILGSTNRFLELYQF